MNTQDDRDAAFRHLHAAGCFVMPNPWDADLPVAAARTGPVTSVFVLEDG